MKKVIDINVDLGEGAGFDDKLMPLVSSCNIACGGHFGDASSIRETMKLAKNHKVKIGAHPSYPDPDDFGRRVMKISSEALKNAVKFQLNTFFGIAKELDVKVHHIKLHGALYNEAAGNKAVAGTIVETLDELELKCSLYVPYGSVLHELAKTTYPLEFEAFIDRRYNADLTLVSRSHPKALIMDKNAAWKQLEEMVHFGKVKTINNTIQSITASTFCIHGDTKGSVEILQFIRKKMKNADISI